MSRTASSFWELTVPSGKSKCPVMIVLFPEVTQWMAVRPLESRGSFGAVTLRLGAWSTVAQDFKVPPFFPRGLLYLKALLAWPP